MKSNIIYFDHASTSPLSNNVLNTINKSYQKYWGNVSSTYKIGIDCAFELERIRIKIAKLFNAEQEDVIFTSGSTESITLVFNQIDDNYKPQDITISAIEHNATTIASNKLKKRGWNINEWPVDSDGIIKLDDIEKFINKKTKLVSIIWGQSEIGTLQPVQIIGKKCKDENIIFHVDGTQIISNGIFNWKNLNCDLLSFSAHKFGGPKGIGILLTNKKSREIIRNPDISSTQEYSIRPGTQALPLISGLCQALCNIKGRIIHKEELIYFKDNNVRLLTNYLMDKLKNNNRIQITGSLNHRLPNHLSFILLNKDYLPIKAYKIINYMSDNNISISSGSACSSSKNKQSIILAKLNFEESKLSSNLRVSLSINNNLSQVDKFYDLILKCIDIF